MPLSIVENHTWLQLDVMKFLLISDPGNLVLKKKVHVCYRPRAGAYMHDWAKNSHAWGRIRAKADWKYMHVLIIRLRLRGVHAYVWYQIVIFDAEMKH